MTVQELQRDVADTNHMLRLMIDYKEDGIRNKSLVDKPIGGDETVGF